MKASGTMANYKNVGYKTTSTSTSAKFEPITTGGGIFFEGAKTEITFAAYAPYSETASASTLPGSDGKIAVNTSSQAEVADQEKIDYLYATGATASKSKPTVSFTGDYAFKHKMARLILKVEVSKNDGFSSGDVLNLADYKLGGLIHEGTFDMTSGTAAVNGTAVTDWELRKCSGEGNSRTATNKCVASYSNEVMTLTMILLPQTLSKALAFSVAPNDGESQTYSNSTTIQPELKAGNSYSYTVTVKKTGLVVSGCTITDWTSVTDVAAEATM